MINKFGKGALSLLPMSGPSATSKAPTAPTAPSATRAPGAARAPSQQGARPTAEERDKVSSMQELILSFGKAINENPAALKNILSRENISRLQSAIGNMGVADGKLGRGTVNALNWLKLLIKETGVVGDLIIKDFKQATAEEIEQIAEKNTAIIASLMKNIGFGDRVPENLAVKPMFYDVVPAVLSNENVKTQVPIGDGVIVRPDDLQNIRNFFIFVQDNLDLLTKEAKQKLSLEKIAFLIKEKSIITVGQDNRIRTSLDEEVMVPKGMTVGKIDQILVWFGKRAKALRDAREVAFRSGETVFTEDGREIPKATKQDVISAAEYLNDIKRLYLVWDAQRKSFIKEGQDPYQAIVSVSQLVDYKNINELAKAKLQELREQKVSPGAARVRRTEMDSGSDDISISGRVSFQPPLAPRVDLEQFTGNNKYWDFLNQYVAVHSFNIEDFKSRSAKNIADFYMNNAAKERFKNPGGFVQMLTKALQNIFRELVTAWRVEATEKRMPDFKKYWDIQMNHLSKWNYVLGYQEKQGKRLSEAILRG